MSRAGWACLLAVAAIVGVSSCSSSEPGPATATASLHTAVSPVESCASCLDIHLGGFNLFLLESYSGGHLIEGKVAAGGNITLDNFGVGEKLTGDDFSNTLVAGGDLKITNGNVFGATWYGGSYTHTWDVNFHKGPPVKGTPIDFAARFSALRALSAQLATRPINGITEPKWGNVYMTGTDPCLNVFEVSASDFNSALTRNIAVPDGSFAVINIHGTGPAFVGGFNPGFNPRRVLYNYVDATSLTANGVGLQGTILAPYAHLTVSGGSWTGGIYAVSLSGDATLRLGPLDDMEGAKAEVCNGVDDDCNGQVDDGFECTGSGSQSCTAWCGAAGTKTCNPATCGYGECTSASCCKADADCASGSYCEGSLCTEKKGNGAACSGASQCSSGECVDGVCCDTACAGACDACNLTGLVGTCSMAPSTVECRAAGGDCDVAESCTGTSAECPADGKKPATTLCRASSDVCELDAHCTGTSNACPANGYASSTTQCRDAQGDCDLAAYCTGTGASCPANGSKDSGEACASDSNACTSDVCNGAGACSHPLVAAGTSCGSGLVCTAAGQCVSQCWIGGVSYAAGAINPSNPCQVCTPSVSTTNWSSKASGEACTSDSNACTSDVCNGAGTCTHPLVAAGTSCGSGQICSSTGQCVSECWIGGVSYAAGATNPSNSCEVCTPSVSTSSWSSKASGAACTSDNNACTSDVCNGAGTCTHPLVSTGTSCGAGQICTAAGQCVSECWIGGVSYVAGATNLSNSCEVCTPSVSTTSWSSKASGVACTSDNNACTTDVCNGAGTCSHPLVAAGTSCGSGLACTAAGECVSQCLIGGVSYAAGATNPSNSCQVCTPSTSTTNWSSKASGMACTSDNNACTTDVCNGAGTCSHPVVAAGTSCGAGLICSAAGQCVSECLIGGVSYAAGATNPSNSCEVCTPSTSTTSWSSKASGMACTSDNNACTSDVCNGAGTCTHPLVSAGTSCGAGQICSAAGQCVSECFIGGTSYAAGATNPSNPCQVCTPSSSTTNWSSKASGAVCTSDGNACTSDVCNGAGTCGHLLVPAGTWCGEGMSCTSTGGCVPSSCSIGGTSYAAGAINPFNSCQVCTPSASTTSWSSQSFGVACNSDNNACTSDMCNGAGTCIHPQASAGTWCGWGMSCTSTGQCVGDNECLIGGIAYVAGTINSNNKCQMCSPSQSRTDWSPSPSGTLCRGSAGVCDAPDYCTGFSTTCPGDAKEPTTTQCRGSAGVCDVAEFCTGTSNSCPGDAKRPSNFQCYSPTSSCDLPSFCGGGNSCPDPFAPKTVDLCREGGNKAFGTACSPPSDPTAYSPYVETCNGAGTCIERGCNPLTSKSCFVTQLYRDVQNRKADLGGYNFWMQNALPSCVDGVSYPDRESPCWVNRADLVYAFLTSSESQLRHPRISGDMNSCIYQKAFIKALYYDLLQRKETDPNTPYWMIGPDGVRPDEVNFWLGGFDGNYGADGIVGRYKRTVRHFMNSSPAEYHSRFPNP